MIFSKVEIFLNLSSIIMVEMLNNIGLTISNFKNSSEVVYSQYPFLSSLGLLILILLSIFIISIFLYIGFSSFLECIEYDSQLEYRKLHSPYTNNDMNTEILDCSFFFILTVIFFIFDVGLVYKLFEISKYLLSQVF